MVHVRQHRQRFQARVRIPAALKEHYGAREHLYRHLATTDGRVARLEADAWEARLRIEWAAKQGSATPSRAVLRELYASILGDAAAGKFRVFGDGEECPDELGIGFELDKLADNVGERELTQSEEVQVAALQDALDKMRGGAARRRPELEPSFGELASDFMANWRTQHGLKASNTEQQKLATFDLFGKFWGDRHLRDVRKADAAAFVDALRRLDPLWGRSPSQQSKEWTWSEIQRVYGNRPRGLAAATINRHMATLAALWRWGQDRDHCEGNNPFKGFHSKLKDGRNMRGYLAWEADELERLFNPPPKRSDLCEVMLVAMFSGMRLGEIASLTWGQVRESGGVTFFQVMDAKTTAGVRQVPVHPRLAWLILRKSGDADARIWPGFNPEGPGKKAGADAGKEFSRFKLALGFTDRRKVFHSFRKNVVGQMEAKSVPQSEVAQLVGHERGFTYKVYGGGVPLQRLAEIVALIDYPGVTLPSFGQVEHAGE